MEKSKFFKELKEPVTDMLSTGCNQNLLMKILNVLIVFMVIRLGGNNCMVNRSEIKDYYIM